LRAWASTRGGASGSNERDLVVLGRDDEDDEALLDEGFLALEDEDEGALLVVVLLEEDDDELPFFCGLRMRAMLRLRKK